MGNNKEITFSEAMQMFGNLSGEPPKLEYWGIRSPRVPQGKERIHLTAVPFVKDRILAELAASASVKGEPLLAFVVQGDPDEDVEAVIDRYKRTIGTWKVNPYNNVVITTFHPDCAITNDLANAPAELRVLIEHIEKHYLSCDKFPEWAKAHGLIGSK